MTISSDLAFQERLVFENNRLVPVLYGEQNAHLRQIEDSLNVQISCKGNEVRIAGTMDDADAAREVLQALWSKIEQGQDVDTHTVDSALRFLEEREKNEAEDGEKKSLGRMMDGGIQIITRKKKIQPRSPVQAEYIDAMQKSRMVFALGPAGTGKTYLAVAQAVSLFEAGKIERIILTRPAVEAGERLGYLPGEMKEKMDPYMRPLYDSLHDTLSSDRVQKMIATEEIEIAPLAFMRGRTLNNSFIILDEAQNTTDMQMKMFLTRLGESSHMVVTGDPSQIDLPKGQSSGLLDAEKILGDVQDITFIRFSHKDVVRSKLVTMIIKAYEAFENKSGK